MSKRKQKTPVKKIVSQHGPGFPAFMPTHADAILDLRGKLASTDTYVDIKVIIPNRDGTFTQYYNRFTRR